MNLRKDHCRHLQSRATREPFFNARDTGGAPVRPVARKLRTLGVQPTPGYGAPNKPRRAKRQGTPTIGHAPVALGSSVLGLLFNVIKSKRLSATDISALASMKNVAKCDTWCELQNPVNHRVFERKLRPKPSGRGHACLGVTHRVAPPRPRSRKGRGRSGGAEVGFPCSVAASLKQGSLAADVATSGGRRD